MNKQEMENKIMQGLKDKVKLMEEKELKRREWTNEYGVKYVNRLVEEHQYNDTRYVWYQDTIQENGKTFTKQFAAFKQMKRMNAEMDKYKF